LKHNPVCALLGPRQSGKTTLARELAARRRNVHFFDLETAAGRARLAEPELTLAPLEGLIVIDEIQRRPALFEALRPLADRPKATARFLLLGSASPGLVRGVSESLAGRVGFVDLGGFDISEVGPREWRRLWVRGGFPRSYLAANDEVSLKWRRNFIGRFSSATCLSSESIPAESLGRFWMMLAHYHGQI
jgi:predicted AAA+ superfamily ATPase